MCLRRTSETFRFSVSLEDEFDDFLGDIVGGAKIETCDGYEPEYDGGRLASVGHGCPLLFRPHPGGPRLRFDDLSQADNAAAHLPVKPSSPVGGWRHAPPRLAPVRSTTYRKLMLDGLNKDAYLRPITPQDAAVNESS